MTLKILKRVSLTLACLVLVATAAKADTFTFPFFDFISDSVVGTGTFSFDDSLGDGTYALDDLTNYNMNFTIGSSTFTNADIATPTSEVLVTVYHNGLNFYFDNTGGLDGPFGGSIDFAQGSDPGDPSLSTEPFYFGAPPLDLFEATDSNHQEYFGTYDFAPEPATLLLLIPGLAGLAWRRRRLA